MRVAVTVVSFTLACGLTFAAESAPQGTPTNPPGQPSQPGQPTQPGQPGQPTPGQPGQPTRPGQPTQPGQPTPGQGAPQPGSQTSQNNQTNREVTLTGCVARDTSAPASGGQATQAFLLTRVQPASGAGAATSPGGRAQGSAGATNMGQEYRLMASGKVDLSAHLNRQVRVTGTMMDASAAAGASGANRPQAGSPSAGSQSGAPSAGSANPGAQSPGSGSGSTARGGASAAQAPMFHVTSLTMVSATCDMK